MIRAFEAKILVNLGFVSFDDSLLQKLVDLPWDEIEKMKIDVNQAMELEKILRYHIERVIEGSLKSRKFLKWIK